MFVFSTHTLVAADSWDLYRVRNVSLFGKGRDIRDKDPKKEMLFPTYSNSENLRTLLIDCIESILLTSRRPKFVNADNIFSG